MIIVLCTTIPATLGFSTSIISRLKSEGHRVIIMSSDEAELSKRASEMGVEYKYVPFYRGINPLKDVKAIRKLRKLLRKLEPDIIIGATPKAAMVTMITGKLAGIKKRVYHIYGLPYETAKGVRLQILKLIERITGACATHIVPIGSSVKESTLSNKLFKPRKIIQKGLLTVGGVNTVRFNPDAMINDRRAIREGLGVSENDIIIGYVARYTYDKGFCDLIDLWKRLKKNPKIHLMLVGSMDTRVPVVQSIVDEFFSELRVHNMGYHTDVERMFSAMDIFLFPSYREGFGNVSIEASAMGIPVVTYNVTGCKDAVENNVSGYVVGFKDYDAIENKISELANDKNLRIKLGKQGRKRVSELFTVEKVASNFVETINTLNDAPEA